MLSCRMTPQPQPQPHRGDIARWWVARHPVMLVLAAALAVCFTAAAGKLFERCELARELYREHEIPKQQIATWVCIARHESEYNTSAFNPSSGDHGLFQISELFWCSEDSFGGGACGLPCSSFRDDDISDDIVCARRIFREHTGLSGNGFNAWVVYPIHCKNNVDKYVDDCFIGKEQQNEVKNIEEVTLSTLTAQRNRVTTTYPTTTRRKTTSYIFPTKYTTLSSARKYYDSTTTPKYFYSYLTTTTPTPSSKSLYNSRAFHFNKITTQKSTTRQESKYNIYSRHIHKTPHKFIEHPTGHRYKYNINKSGFALFKDN